MKPWSVALFLLPPFNGLLVVDRIEREFLFRSKKQIVPRGVENAAKQWGMYNGKVSCSGVLRLDEIQNTVSMNLLRFHESYLNPTFKRADFSTINTREY